ncbi:MAG: glycosyltransferase family 2 protein [Clostridia bacterium]|nr:glycosyltransferase family 2 protein [Clostridia bacterium]
MKKIDIVVPIFNEEDMIGLFLNRLCNVINNLKNYQFEILFIDDGSKDKSLAILKECKKLDNRINYISLSRNFGKEAALLAGIDYCDGDAVIFIDVDLQDPPEIIPEMISNWEEGYEDVYAQRKTRRGDSFLKKLTAKLYYFTLQSVTSVDIQKDTGDFRLLDRKCIDALKNVREVARNSKGIFSWIGFKKKAILYDREPRKAGKSKWNYKKLFRLAADGITSFTISPLRTSIYIGIPVLITFFGFFAYYLINHNTFSEEISFQNIIILLILLFAGIQIILFGIIGEYLGRIFLETKHRPLYLVREESKTKAK